jgi:uncharacterized membrane protein
MKQKKLWNILAISASVGLLASLIQTIERISYSDNPSTKLACDINAIFSCTNVFDAWQSSVFGFSNSIMCLAFFGITLGVALAGASADKLGKNLRLIMHFFAVFFLLFGAWYLLQSTFVIGYLCIFCIFCYSGVIGMNWAWLRINANDLPISKNARKSLANGIAKGADTFAWLLWAIVIAAMFVFKFW